MIYYPNGHSQIAVVTKEQNLSAALKQICWRIVQKSYIPDQVKLDMSLHEKLRKEK
jgi:hypothetical protein